MNPLRDGRAFFRTVARNPRRWLFFQLYCFRLAVLPHDKNNDFRKLTTTALFAVWIALTFGLGPGRSFQYYDVLFGVSMLILGQQWELEKIRFGPFQIAGGDDDDE